MCSFAPGRLGLGVRSVTFEQWRYLLHDPVDVLALTLFVLVFPVYHAVYPRLMTLFPHHAAKVRMDEMRRSWIERLIRDSDVTNAAQQARNLTMANSLVASSSLILMGFTANILIRLPDATGELPEIQAWRQNPDELATKLLLLVFVFGVGFGYAMTALRHLGHFTLAVGADPAVIERHEGSAVDYLSALINRASNRSTLAMRCMYSASPLFLWLIDSRLSLGLTVIWGAKFIFFQDFAHVLRQRGR
jgi:uncharacterized membrane protein